MKKLLTPANPILAGAERRTRCRAAVWRQNVSQLFFPGQQWLGSKVAPVEVEQIKNVINQIR